MEIGNLAEWFAAIGTVGSLILALRIIQRDRRLRDESLANRLITVYDDVDPDLHPQQHNIEVYILNNSDRPFFGVRLMHRWKGEGKAGWWNVPIDDAPRDRLKRLMPGESATITWDDFALQRDEHPEFRAPTWAQHDYTVSFEDADGRHWERDFRTHEYLQRAIPKSGAAPIRARIRAIGWRLRQALDQTPES